MRHPRYIQVQGNLYRIVEAEREAPTSFADAIGALLDVYSRLMSEADTDPGLHEILDVVNFVRSAAQDIEKKLPDALRPGTGTLAGWSARDEFMDTLQELNKTYKKLYRAWRAADRRKALQQFAMNRGVHVPEAQRMY